MPFTINVKNNFRMTEDSHDSFIKASSYGNSKSIYFHSGYTEDNEKFKYHLKDVIEGANTTSFLIDQPTLVQVLCAPKNYGTDIELWDFYGIESEVYQRNSSFSLLPDLDAIPDDWYYITVVRYCDGSDPYITEPKKK